MADKTVYLVPHTHWDREWYFTAEKSKIYLVNNMAEILDMLEHNQDYPCYVLDGQSVVLEDYLSAVPQNKERIANLVAQGRLKIGPWYTQTDEMVVGGESIVRNLLYGKLDCECFGGRMMIGYLPDSFGQSAAMPKILNGFGIEKSLFWRGYSQRLGIDKTEFLWSADDGSQVVVQLLPINYSVGITIPKDREKIRERFDKAFEILENYSSTGCLLVPNGHDQMPVQQDIFEVIEILKEEYPQYNFKLGSYEDMFEQIGKNSLKNITGEFYDGKYMRVHRSISSSRADIKTLNTRIENKITNILEPLASVAYSLGFEYQSGTIEQIWRRMLKNHAHDSIGCCCTDNVNKQVEMRFVGVEDSVDNLLDFYMRKLIETSNGSEDKLIVFNGLPYARRARCKVEVSTYFENFDIVDGQGKAQEFEIISCEKSVTRDESENCKKNYCKYQIAFYDEIPAMGYKIYKIVESENAKAQIESSTDTVLENAIYKIEINKNGSLNIEEKNTGNVYKDVLIFEDSADDGDSYDYSPIENDVILTSENVSANIKTNKCSYFEEANISFRLEVPKDMQSRLENKIDGHIDANIRLCLDKESPVIALKIDIDNQAKDHRVRVLVPQNLSADKSVADVQFGKLERDSYDSAMDVWQSENWDERPDAIYPFLSFVRTNNSECLAVLSNSVREFEITNGKLEHDTIAITLFRSYGKQGRADLLRRPGRASGTKIETPDAQLIGTNSYEIALTTSTKDIANLAKAYTSPVVAYATDPVEDLALNVYSIDVPAKFSLLEIKKSAIVFSALKKAEAEEGLCIRLYNSSSVPQKFNLKGKCLLAAELMLDETQKNGDENLTNVEFKPFEIKTFMLKV